MLDKDNGPEPQSDQEENQFASKTVPESQLSPKVQRLIKMIFNTEMMKRSMAEIGYDGKCLDSG